MVISELLAMITKELGDFENAPFEAAQILGAALSLSQTELVLKKNAEVSESDEIKALSLVKRRLTHEPLQYILGFWEFMSLPFFVSPDTLIPRADTETLAEFVLSERRGLPTSLLDIGTGTGCIPISLAHFEKNFVCLGIDISAAALRVAEKNAERNGVSDRVSFEKCDILSELPQNKYDAVVSNPPYIKSRDIGLLQTEVRDFEPRAALDGGDDGLIFYRRICGIAPKILKSGGLLAFETGFDQSADVSELMKNDFKDIRTIKDLCGNDRVVAGYLA